MDINKNEGLLKLRDEISSVPNKLIHIVWKCLSFTNTNTQCINDVGVYWINDKQFVMNALIFGQFSNRIPNTLNRNLRMHGFHCRKTSSKDREFIFGSLINGISDLKNWTIRWCDGFTRSTSEHEAICWKNCQYQKSRKSVSTQNSVIESTNNSENLLSISSENDKETEMEPFQLNCPFNDIVLDHTQLWESFEEVDTDIFKDSFSQMSEF